MTEVHRYKVIKMLSEGGNRISYDPHGPEVVMAEAYDQLKAENEALRKDAERYRWLRQASATDGEHTHGVCIDLWENGCGFEVTLEEADAAVDAAMTTGARP